MPKWILRFGKYALIAYIAYNIVEITILLIFFPQLLGLGK